MRYSNQYYPSAYMLLPDHFDLNGLADFNTAEISNHQLLYSKDVLVNSYSHNEKSALIVGYCLDTRDEKLDQSQIAENLLKSEDIVEDLEYINGRYFLLVSSSAGTALFSDASQLQPLVYHKPSGTLSSHDRLLADVLMDRGFNLRKRPGRNHTELDFTRYEDIYKMNPSLKLTMDTFNFERIYPREQLEGHTAEATFEQMRPFLEAGRDWVGSRKEDIFLTLTAGIDSRVSAALTRPFRGRVEYLTYYTPEKFLATPMAKIIHRIDKNVTEQMKENLGWNHAIINLSDYKPSEEMISEWRKTFNSSHAFALINYYRKFKKYDHALHIKSTVFGMGKADFKKELDQHEDTFEFYKKCIHGLSKTFLNHYDEEAEIEEYFERNFVYEGVTLGRHYFDLFHLESRMGNWHSTLTLETDPEVDEFIFMNTRKMIDLMQQPPIQERRHLALYKAIVNHYWPVLLHFGINSEKNAYEQTSEHSAHEIEWNGLYIKSESQMGIRMLDESAVEIKPGVGKTKSYDINSIQIFNLNDVPKKIKVKSTYTNPKGKGVIKVMIRTSNQHKVYDLLSLNKPVEIEVGAAPYSIMLLYNKNYDRDSWRDAGTLLIEAE